MVQGSVCVTSCDQNFVNFNATICLDQCPADYQNVNGRCEFIDPTDNNTNGNNTDGGDNNQTIIIINPNGTNTT